MSGSLANVVAKVVSRNLCSGCGVCAGTCPQDNLTMGVRANGDLIPHFEGSCARRCSICLAVCPFTNEIHDPRALNRECFGAPDENERKISMIGSIRPQLHEECGWHLMAIAGYSPTHRAGSASGGLLTWCLEELLTRREVDKVAVVKGAPPGSKSLFHFRSIASPADLRACAGSVYYPVEISGVIGEILADGKSRWAIVGVPCLCTAMRKATRRLPKLSKAVKYLLGTACGMYQNSMYTEMLIKVSGLSPTEIGRVRYRVKRDTGPASNYCFTAETRGGRIGRPLPYHGLPNFLGANGYFRVNACNFCKDVFAESADACFMDGWLPEYVSDPCGTSLVLIRNGAVQALFDSTGERNGSLITEKIAISRLLASQAGQIRRKRKLIEMRLRGNHSGPHKFSFRDRFEWWLQQRTQERSKNAWARYRFDQNTFGFWLANLDLLVMQKGFSSVNRFAHLTSRLHRKIFHLDKPRAHVK